MVGETPIEMVISESMSFGVGGGALKRGIHCNAKDTVDDDMMKDESGEVTIGRCHDNI